MNSHPYDAVLFDLDGVLTPTAALHARCWKQREMRLRTRHGSQPSTCEMTAAQHQPLEAVAPGRGRDGAPSRRQSRSASRSPRPS